jgi:peptide methionine sulfoxide reductase MsrA
MTAWLCCASGVCPLAVQVCSKQTGHAEVVAITFDPSVITFRDLLDVFFTVRGYRSGVEGGGIGFWGSQVASCLLVFDMERKTCISPQAGRLVSKTSH